MAADTCGPYLRQVEMSRGRVVQLSLRMAQTLLQDCVDAEMEGDNESENSYDLGSSNPIVCYFNGGMNMTGHWEYFRSYLCPAVPPPELTQFVKNWRKKREKRSTVRAKESDDPNAKGSGW